jgi:hypothetical protein
MRKKYLVSVTLFLVLFFFLIGGKVIYSQRVHFTNAEQYFAKSDWKSAMREYDLTMHFYSPVSPYIQKSAERLWQLGEMFEKKGKPDWAIIAYSSIRSSFYASRSLYTPGKEWIEKCDEKISSLNVNALISEGTIKPEEAESEKEKHLFVMKTDRAPDPIWTVLLEVGFFGWIASVVFVIVQGFDGAGKMRRISVAYGMVFFIISFAVWVISSLKA